MLAKPLQLTGAFLVILINTILKLVRFINPISFIPFPSHGLDAMLHQKVILENP